MEVHRQTALKRKFSLLNWFKSKSSASQNSQAIRHQADTGEQNSTVNSEAPGSAASINSGNQPVDCVEPVLVIESNRDDPAAADNDESGNPPPKKVRENSIEIIDLDSENSELSRSVETDLELSQSANKPLEYSVTHTLTGMSPALVSCAENFMTPTLDDSVQDAHLMQSQDSDNSASPQPLHGDIAAVATDSPVQPINIRYPVTLYSNKPRSFNPDWFKLYPWLEYSVKEDACFCFPCRMFGGSGGVSTSRPHKTFTEIGFKSWKHATGKDGILKGHDESYSHKSALIAWNEFKRQPSSVVDQMGGNRQQHIVRNRHYLKTVCEVLLLCSYQEIAMRGHREDEMSTNKGNFLEILSLVAKHDEVVKSQLNFLPRNAQYMSPKIQNDLIAIMAGMVRNHVTVAVRDAGMFSILVDESKDLSKKEQMAIVLCCVHKSTHTVHEHFLTFVKAESLTADSLSQYILKTLEDCNLDPSLMVSQGYDGASVMSGTCSGVQQRIKAVAPKAIYVHCYAHCLNLALVDCVRNVQEASEFFALMELLYVFTSSTKAHVLYTQKQTELHPDKQPRQLQRLSDTRWACRYFAIDAICCTFDSVLATLEDISNGVDKSRAVEAKGILGQICCFKFLLLLVMFCRILSFTKALSDQLQSVSNDIARAANLVQGTIKTLTSLRNDKAWDHIYKYTQDVARLNNIKITDSTSGRPSRSKRLPKRLQSAVVMESTGAREAADVNNSKAMYYCILDSILRELKRRFENKNLSIMRAIQSCNPQSSEFLNSDIIQPLAEHYNLDAHLLFTECKLAQNTFKDKALESVREFWEEVCGYDSAFSELKKLLQIVLTIVVTTASCERSFSTLKRIKNYLRTSMTDERLSNLATISIEKDVCKTINLDSVIDKFNGDDNNRRITLS